MAMVISPRSKIVTLSLLIGIITVVAFIVTVIGIWHKSEKPGKTGTKVVSSKLQQITGYTATKHVSRKFLSYRMERRIITALRNSTGKIFFSRLGCLQKCLQISVCTHGMLFCCCRGDLELSLTVFLCKKKKKRKKSKVRMTVFTFVRCRQEVFKNLFFRISSFKRQYFPLGGIFDRLNFYEYSYEVEVLKGNSPMAIFLEFLELVYIGFVIER